MIENLHVASKLVFDSARTLKTVALVSLQGPLSPVILPKVTGLAGFRPEQIEFFFEHVHLYQQGGHKGV